MNMFTCIFEAVGLLATALFLVYLALLAGNEFRLWRLRDNRVHGDLNEHADKLRDHLKRIEFLEHCEHTRNAAENEARNKKGAK